MKTGPLVLEALPRVAVAAGVDERTARRAAAAVAASDALFLAYSGWLASGKDTVAAAVNTAVGDARVVHCSMADPLKQEVTVALEICAASGDCATAVNRLAAHTPLTRVEAVSFCATIAAGRNVVADWDAIAATVTGVTAWDRTDVVRAALQYYGTDVFRRRDADHWVKKAVAATVPLLAAGQVPYFTDVRFPNEVVGLQHIGLSVVRIEVTRTTQAARLLARDGLLPDPAKLAHPSETALDGYDGFDLVVSNDGPLGDTVDTILAAFLRAG
jgi:hypothetical protein